MRTGPGSSHHAVQAGTEHTVILETVALGLQCAPASLMAQSCLPDAYLCFNVAHITEVMLVSLHLSAHGALM